MIALCPTINRLSWNRPWERALVVGGKDWLCMNMIVGQPRRFHLRISFFFGHLGFESSINQDARYGTWWNRQMLLIDLLPLAPAVAQVSTCKV